ncbi:MAG: peptidoglycan-binding protein, partial [Desulfurococcales archaeon]|nr:peptidoglycan-binding protein [Desulfurococcales archaeon]
YVDLRVDDHEEPVEELKRLFRIWEITILEREDPNDVVELSDPSVAEAIQKALAALGFYKGPITGRADEATAKALEEWMAINNFENKIRRDGKVWGTVYRFLIDEARRRGARV